jgi:glycosyltransferase involved in cell wall biosynthesis
MFYPPNAEGVYWFATRVFPTVRRALPDVQFNVVGSRPQSTIRRLANAESGIAVIGYVADLHAILRQSGVLVVPVHSGSGMRVKILEAFARGIPVVSTSVGVEGIDAVSPQHLLVADDPEGFAEAVIRVLADVPEAERLAHAGRRLVEERYHWRTALSGLDEIYERLPALREA